jgi:uncharacterized protein
MKTVIYHSADFDGIFCREIAKKFLGENDVQYIGWNFGDPKISIELSPDRTFWTVQDGRAIGRTVQFYVMDLPVDKVFGIVFAEYSEHETLKKSLVWIDHHKSSIETHPTDILGYRIDGVAACRLAWQWFVPKAGGLPSKQDYLERNVIEPIAVRLAGEYDIWDHRGDGDLELQFGLRCIDLTPEGWSTLLSLAGDGAGFATNLIERGKIAMQYAKQTDASVIKSRGYITKWEGFAFLTLNSARFNSLTFEAMDVLVTGHDALLGFCWNGKAWTVSLYHAKHRKDIDLSQIAVKYGGGGHRGACGFTCDKLPFL